MDKRFESHFERVVGGDENEKEEAREILQGLSEEEDNIPLDLKLEKTERDKTIITAVEIDVDRMVASYGGQGNPLPQERIHLIKPGSSFISNPPKPQV